MKLIVGLGNYDEKYLNTRHNTGFLVMDEIAKALNVSISKKNFDALTCKTKYQGEDILLMKPLTYMNNSGVAVRKAVDYYHIDVDNDLLVIYDDLDLPYGTLRLRASGGHGCHNGIKSVIANISSSSFKRIRVGIQQNRNIDTVDYVLGKVEKELLDIYNQSLLKASKAALDFVVLPFDKVMNNYNRKDE